MGCGGKDGRKRKERKDGARKKEIQKNPKNKKTKKTKKIKKNKKKPKKTKKKQKKNKKKLYYLVHVVYWQAHQLLRGLEAWVQLPAWTHAITPFLTSCSSLALSLSPHTGLKETCLKSSFEVCTLLGACKVKLCFQSFGQCCRTFAHVTC